MMTMHSAKGLSSRRCSSVGMEEGLFPARAAYGEPEEMEEERRLCYVRAHARVRERLYQLRSSEDDLRPHLHEPAPPASRRRYRRRTWRGRSGDPARQAEHREQGEGQRYLGFGKRRVAPPQRQTPDQAPAPAERSGLGLATG